MICLLYTSFEKYKEPGYKFLTPSGKVELYSSVIEDLARETGLPFDPLPAFEYPASSVEKHPEWEGVYPLVMITGCLLYTSRSPRSAARATTSS